MAVVVARRITRICSFGSDTYRVLQIFVKLESFVSPIYSLQLRTVNYAQTTAISGAESVLRPIMRTSGSIRNARTTTLTNKYQDRLIFSLRYHRITAAPSAVLGSSETAKGKVTFNILATLDNSDKKQTKT